MANKELRIPHSEIKDSNRITQRNAEEFKKAGLDIHRHGVEELVDDDSRGERIIKVKKPTKFFFMGK